MYPMQLPFNKPFSKANKNLQSKVEQAAKWREEHPIHAAWIAKAAAQGNAFAKSLNNSLLIYGSLTLNQVAAVSRIITREENDAIQAVEAPSIAGAGLDKLVQTLANAKAKGLKKPKFRVNELTFSLAPLNGKNAGAIYVVQGVVYCGKIQNNKFLPAGAIGEAVAAEVAHIATDPLAAAIASGKKNGFCACCGKELTDPKSVEAGIGPVCAKKFFH